MKKNYVVKHTGTMDYIFKTIFQNKRILSSYLKILGLDVKEKDIIYENVESKEDIKVKAVRFDIRIHSENLLADLESQRERISGKDEKGNSVDGDTYQRHRMIHYLCMLHSRAYEQGEKYFEERKSKVIFFADYETKGKEAIQRTKLVNTTTGEFYEEIEVIEIALKKVKKDATLKSRMLRVLTEEDLTDYIKEEGIIGEVAKMIFEINQEEHEKNVKRYEEDMRRLERDISYLKYYDGYYDGKDEGKKAGIILGKKQGLSRGKKEEKLATAKRLKELGVSDEIISIGTGLSVEKIKSL